MAKHTFEGKIHTLDLEKEKLFVLMNNGDYFGASVFPERSQLEQLKQNDQILMLGNVRQTKGANGDYFTNITCGKGEVMRIAVKRGGDWVEVEATEVVGGEEPTDRPF